MTISILVPYPKNVKKTSKDLVENTKENLKTEALASSVQTLKFKISSFNKESPMNNGLHFGTIYKDSLGRFPFVVGKQNHLKG